MLLHNDLFNRLKPIIPQIQSINYNTEESNTIREIWIFLVMKYNQIMKVIMKVIMII
jgi:hypothetical protein